MSNSTAGGGIDAQQVTLLKAIDDLGAITLDGLRNLIAHDGLDLDIRRFLDVWEDYGVLWVDNDVVRIQERSAGLVASLVHEYSSENEDTQSDETPSKPYEVSKLKVEQRTLSVFQALRKIEKEEINISPEFQRAFVWDVVRQSRLIESILIRIPLPAFYLDATNEVCWNVVDGLQRLTTLFRYCRGDSFPLKGLEFLTELDGLRFSELPGKYRVMIEDDTQLIFNNLLPGTPTRAKFTIFSRVNTGGLQLTAQEIRHALNQGAITWLLKEISQNSVFLNATGRAVESKRMSDRELILRALSFMHFGYEAYREYGDFDAFLVDSMERFNGMTYNQLNTLANDFFASLEKVVDIFDQYAFRKTFGRGGRRNPFNKALFETWVVNVRPYRREVLAAHKEEIFDEAVRLLNSDEQFLRSITYATGSPISVRTRLDCVRTLLRGVVGRGE